MIVLGYNIDNYFKIENKLIMKSKLENIFSQNLCNHFSVIYKYQSNKKM